MAKAAIVRLQKKLQNMVLEQNLIALIDRPSLHTLFVLAALPCRSNTSVHRKSSCEKLLLVFDKGEIFQSLPWMLSKYDQDVQERQPGQLREDLCSGMNTTARSVSCPIKYVLKKDEQ